MLRRLLPALGAVVLVSLLAGPALARSTEAKPEDRVTFGLGPGGQAFIDQRAVLTYTLPPGGEVVDRVAAFNQSNQALPLLVYAADAVNSESGKLDAKPRADRPEDVGGWVRLGADVNRAPEGRSLVRLNVPAQSAGRGIGKVLVPIRITVPRDATPGDHAGAVIAGLLARGDNATSANLELEQRVALRVYVRVAGKATPGLAVRVLDADYAGGSGLGLRGTLRVTYEVKNTGNTRLGALTSLTAKGPFGIGGSTVKGSPVQELIPGGRALLTAEIPGIWPTVIGHVTVTATASAAPSTLTPRLRPVSDSARFWAVTWQEVVALLLLVALLVHRRRRRATHPSPRHAKGGPPPKELVGATGLVVLLVAGLLSLAEGRAEAADLGRIEVSPTVGRDETLFTGAIEDARCPKGTGDSFFSVDGPGLERSTAFLGAGNAKGTGYQYFRNASIANIRTTNTGAFSRSGAFTIRFSCVRFSDGRVVDSYTRVMDYTAGGKGSWRLRGVAASAPTRPPLPGDPYAVNPYAVAPKQSSATAPPRRPSGGPVASAAPTSAASPSPTSVAAGKGTATGTAEAGARESTPVRAWVLLLGSLLAGTVVLAEWQRRRSQRPGQPTGLRQPASP